MKNFFVVFQLRCKVCILILGLGFCKNLCAQVACDPPPAGIVSWWRGEGNALDQIGGNTGTLLDNASYGTGEVGLGFVFDGNSDGVLVATDTTNLWLQNLTIETWVRRASSSTVSYGSGGNGVVFGFGTGGYLLYINSSGILVFYETGTDTAVNGPAITDTNWHHIAITKDGSTVVFYLDGTAYPSPDYNAVFVFAGGAGIGYRPDNGDNSFLGTLDELSVYSRALTAGEIFNIYNAGNVGKCYTPVAPIITSQPTNLTVLLGQAASFSVSAGGTPPLSYQWSYNTVGIVGATNTTLIISNAQFTNAGIYTVRVSNGIGFILSSNAVLAVNAPPSCDAPPSGLVSWWRAEGNVSDSMGVNNGSAVGALGYTNGLVSQAFRMDAASSYVQIANSPSLNPVGSFSIESWIYLTQDVSQSLIFSKWGDQGYGNNRSYELSTISGLGLQFGICDLANQGNGTFQTFNLNGVLTLNAWNNVTATYDSASGIRCIYVNGANVGSHTNTPVAVYNGITPVTIGAWLRGPGQVQSFFPGLIDEVSFYNRALSPAEIQAVYNAGSAGKCYSPAPFITTQPTNQIVSSGQTAGFFVTVGGTQPFGYQWRFNGTNIVSATNNLLTLTNLLLSQSGNYDVVVTNYAGSVTSSPASLDVRFILVNVNGQPAAATNTVVSPATITISGGYPGGFLFYTLDGSTPTTSSTLYSGPISLTNSAVVSALSLSADFTQLAYAAPINVQVIPVYNLKVTAIGGGMIIISPSNSAYASNSVVTLTATASQNWIFDHWTGDATGSQNPFSITMSGPRNMQAIFAQTAYPLTISSPGGGSVTANGLNISSATYYPTGSVVVVAATPSNGWSFISWQGNASGTNNPLNVTINQTNNIWAIFGTVVATNTVGGGRIVLNQPNPIPYGTVLTASAVADAGKYFVTWSGSVSGTNAPTTITVNKSNLLVNALFTALPGGKYSLGVVVVGNGLVAITPQRNYYNPGDSVTLKAATNSGIVFYGWGQDASGTNNQIAISMNTNKTVQAYFLARLITSPAILANGQFQFSFSSAVGVNYGIQYSTNLTAWLSLGTLTGTGTFLTFTDTNTPPEQQRFYRIIVSP